MNLTLDQVQRHVGPRAMKRIAWYELDEPVIEGKVLSGRVAGFAVSARLETPLVSRCTCLYRTACDHVAVLLARWAREPGAFRVEQPAPLDLPDGPAELAAWLQGNDAELLDAPLDDLLGERQFLPRGHALWRWMDGTLAEALEALGAEPDPVAAVAPLRRGLVERIRDRARRRRAAERAASWRERAPAEPALLPLWEACRAALSAEELRRPPGAFGSATLDADREVLAFRTRTSPNVPLEVPVTTGMLASIGSFHRTEVAGVVLDQVIGPLAPEIRAGVLELLASPDWARALRALDAGLSRAGPAERAAVGWAVADEGGRVVRLTPVALEPFKRKEGFRARKLPPTAIAELPTPADRAALAALKAHAPVAVAVEALIEHPAVVDAEGAPLRVRRGAVEVEVRDDDGLRLALLLDGAPLPDGLHGALRGAGGYAALRVGPAVVVVEVGPALEGLAEVLDRFGGVFPDEARAALGARLSLLEGVVPLRLAASMRGRRAEVGVRPVLLLVPLPDGALRVGVRVRPLPEGPLYKPGLGPREVARTDGGVRRFAERDLRREPAEVLRRLAELPLPPLADWEGTHELADDALDLVGALRGRDLEVVWPTGALRVAETSAEGGSMRVRAQRRHDWFGVDGDLETPEGALRLAAVLEAIRAGRRYVRIDEKGWVRLADRLRDALRPLALLASDEPEPRLPPLAAARAMLELERGGVHVELPEELVDLDTRIRAADAIRPRVPPALAAQLRPYQLDGLTWLRRMAAWAPGAVLADEMGLGKTLQALALALDREPGPTLVVAPASVNLNWVREAGRFAPDLRVALYRGPGREALLRAPTGLLVTSWELLVRDVEVLSSVRFATVILDEAQALKNPATQRARAARALDAGFVLALTGTPVENQLLELWSLMRAVAPGLLGPKGQFGERFGAAVMRGDPLGDGNLGRVVRPFILRRTKREVAPELPAREESVDWVELSGPERVVYERIRSAAVAALKAGSERERLAVLAALTRLRQAACAARLVDPDAPEGSSKLDRLAERVEAAVGGGEQVLVFSQFTSLLDLAEARLAPLGVRVLRLDGSTPIPVRQERVDRFQAGLADVFLISLKAGGTGLNLTAASTVILLDPWWNPAAEDQASDRAHRIGQDKRVRVLRLVAAGTVEEEVLAMHAEKRALAASVLDGTGESHRLTSDDLLALLR